ncbi:O23 family O-antigen flippase [Citrobacter portucalensis]|uniref:O23 family O-antigen flippase n=1 Tax=Citrobacter portucalensis TaxID=1639133 RepID=UPI0028C1A41A|nr:O23 family O-antigen flippase [Citrobacter portucalensis]
MFNKIIEKIRGVFLPCINLAASTLFFFSIGTLFGINGKSDFILLTITVYTTVGTILQISWYGLLPRLTTSKSQKFTAIIISNAILYCFLANLLPFMMIPVHGINYIFFAGCSYSLFFQLHQLIKNIYIYIGKLKAFYLFDAAGYFLNIVALFLIRDNITNLGYNHIFLLFSAGWCIIVMTELIFMRAFLCFNFSIKPLMTCVVPTWKTRVANSGFIIKDLLASYALNLFVPGGGLTVYAYTNKVTIAIFQLFSQYKVNKWVGMVREKGLNNIKANDIKKISIQSSFDYSFFLVFTFIFLLVPFIYFKINIDILWAAICVLNSSLLYLIQSIEQPYARYVYMSKMFGKIAIVDGANFITGLFIFMIGYYLHNIYIVLFSMVFAQFVSLYLYVSYSKRIILV